MAPGAETLIHTPNEPGITIEDDVVRMTYFPCSGIRDKARFRIAASRLTR